MSIHSLDVYIDSVEDLGNNIRKIFLGSETDIPEYKSGQYLEIVLPDGKKCPFSIANAPGMSSLLELHVRPTPGSEYSEVIEELINNRSRLHIQMPMGDCFLDHLPQRNLIFVAASTGVTQIKCFIEYLANRNYKGDLYFYWGVLTPDDLYLDSNCSHWEKFLPGFKYIPVVSEEKFSDWSGRKGLVGAAVLEDFMDMSDVEIFISGSPAMVYHTMDKFLERGLPEDRIYSDVFSYAPRAR